MAMDVHPIVQLSLFGTALAAHRHHLTLAGYLCKLKAFLIASHLPLYSRTLASDKYLLILLRCKERPSHAIMSVYVLPLDL
jgi:hypothetical protein